MGYMSQARLSLAEKVSIAMGDPAQKEFERHIYEQALLKADRIIAKKYNICQRYRDISNDTGREIDVSLPGFQSVFRLMVNDTEYKRANVLSGEMYEYALIETETGIKFDYFPKQQTLTEGPTGEYQTGSTVSSVVSDILYDGIDYTGWYLKSGISERKILSHTKTEGEAITFTVEAFDTLPLGKAILIRQYTGGDIVTLCYNIIPGTDDYDTVIIPQKYEEEQVAYAVLYLCRIGVAQYTDEAHQRKYNTLYKIYSKDEKERDSALIKDCAWVHIKPNVWL